MRRHHHYLLARELGQLSAARALVRPEAMTLLARRLGYLGLTTGEAKLNSLQTWGLTLPPEQLAAEGNGPASV